MRHRAHGRSALAVLVATGLCVSCGESRPSTASALDDDAITVGSFNFPESTLLAELYSQALEQGGYEVVRAFDIGPRELVEPALAAGLVELVPEYAGTAVTFLSLGKATPSASSAETHEALLGVLEGRSLTALSPAPAQDANAVVVRHDTAERLGLRRVSDLVRPARTMTLGGPPECASRPLCQVGLETVYGLRFDSFLPLDASGPQTHQALKGGYIDVAVLFTTDPAITDEGWVALADDRQLQPAENVTPIVRTEVVDRWGSRLVDLIDGVSSRLTTAELRVLNGEMRDGRRSAADVARAWLAGERTP